MLLLIIFAFIAGAGTALSPCVLPILPAVFAGAVTGARRRPLGIATGLVASFTFATVALIYLLDALGLPDDFARNLAIVALAAFGITMLVPALSDRLEASISRIAPQPGKSARGDGFGSGFVLGFSLGFVYAPCAGPILAAVVTASASQPFTAEKVLVALAYGAGSGLVIYALMLGGRRLAQRLRPVQARVNLVMGVLMIAFAASLLTDFDLEFRNALADPDTPTFLSNPTKALEESSAVSDNLADVRGEAGGETREEGGAAEAEAGRPLPELGRAPDFTATQRWFNSEPLTLAELRGKVVLIDFWTYTCINCIRTLPYLRAWHDRYEDDGLVIVGVHTPEFPFEREAGNVENAISEYGLEYAVVQDNEYGTWNAWGNQYWPAKYLIDATGQVRYVHFGEGAYATTEKAIRSLLAERGDAPSDEQAPVDVEVASHGVTTPELYLGLARAERIVNGPLLPGVNDYRFSEDAELPPDSIAYEGRWRLGPAGATAVRDATIDLDFGAEKVFLVLGTDGEPRRMRVLLDGEPIAAELSGEDVSAGVAEISEQRLYRLVDLPEAGRHRLELRFEPGISGYAFTFG